MLYASQKILVKIVEKAIDNISAHYTYVKCDHRIGVKLFKGTLMTNRNLKRSFDRLYKKQNTVIFFFFLRDLKRFANYCVVNSD